MVFEAIKAFFFSCKLKSGVLKKGFLNEKYFKCLSKCILHKEIKKNNLCYILRELKNFKLLFTAFDLK